MLALGLVIGFALGALSVTGYRWYCAHAPRATEPFGPPAPFGPLF